MKNLINIKLIALLGIFFLSSCQEDYLDISPDDSIAVGNFFNTNEQVRAISAPLYGRTWFNFHNKAFYAITEVGSGNMFTYSSDVNSNLTFNVSSSDPELANAWASLFANVAQSNFIINELQTRVGANVDQTVVDETIGEAHFMRAVAYFYLVRLFGPVPIIENNLELVDNPQVNTNLESDIYSFIKSDLETAIELLPEKTRGAAYQENMRVSKGSAKSILAKVFLQNNEYAMAAQLSQEVINSGEFQLFGGDALPGNTFADLFLTSNNNNQESIFSLQWKVSADYGNANNCNTQFAYSSYINMAFYGGVFAPSQDIQNLYSAGDARRKETYMVGGDFYPNITTDDGAGFTVPDNIDPQNSGAGIKKYVVGKSSDVAGTADQWGMMENCTYIMRYAELLLIHAEAIAAGGSTTDANALNSINQVRNRAGLADLVEITQENILLERRKELAFEGHYWFDLGRIPRAQAIAIMSAQNRGDQDNELYYTPTESSFVMPYPSSEVIKNPLLQEAPVAYNFD